MKYVLTLGILFVCLSALGCSEESMVISSSNTSRQGMGNGGSVTPSTNPGTGVTGQPGNSGGGYTDPGTVTPTPSTGNPNPGGSDTQPNPGTPEQGNVCSPACNNGEQCIEGTCLPICVTGLTLCGENCLDLASLHLADCGRCAESYCDVNGNLADGCESSFNGNDPLNCGACNHACEAGETCESGVCKKRCGDGEMECNGSCLNLGELHLSSCSSCADNYCDGDSNLANGCEINALGSDAGNCGSCGHACGSGEVCDKGVCATPYNSHRMMVIADELNVRKTPGDGEILGAVYEWEYITVLEEKDGWYRHEFNGEMGWSSGDYLLDACDECAARPAIDYAERFLYDPSTKLCTYDHLSSDPIIENFTDLWKNYGAYNHGYDCNCANFVSACLVTAYSYPGNQINVGQIEDTCDSGEGGWHKIPTSQAKAGDIWVNPSRGHTELVLGYKNGVVYLIGSNNFDWSNYGGCQLNTSSDPSDYQRVSYASTTSVGFICSRQ